MINVQITTPRGRIINEECKFVLVRGSDGERGYLPNHTPVMMNIENGYVRLDGMLDSTFVAINSAVMDLKNNNMTIIGELAATGSSKEEAFENLNKLILKIKEENSKKMVDFVNLEKELAKTIKEMKAGNL